MRERERGEERTADMIPFVHNKRSLTPFVSDSTSLLLKASNALSAASIPLFMALCVPLTFGTFRNPGLQPISAPPGKASLGMLCHVTKRLVHTIIA